MTSPIRRTARALGAVIVAMAAAVASFTLVPAIAQQGGGPGVESYVEVLAGTTAGTNYVRFVDGDGATTDPQQGITGSGPWTLAAEPELLTVSTAANPTAVLAGTGCLTAGGQPIGALPPVFAEHYVRPPTGWLGPIPYVGVSSYACATNPTPQIVPEPARSSLTPGETLEVATGADLPSELSHIKLAVHANNTSSVRVTATLDGSIVGAIDVNFATDCVGRTDWAAATDVCATRVDPYFGTLQQRYLNLDFGGTFDAFEVAATSGSVRLWGKEPSRLFLAGETFGGTIGGDTGEESVSEPPSENLPGYEVACGDAADPPPEGPCGGKEVGLSISRFLADVDGDGTDEQVLNVLPTGVGDEEVLLTLTVEWAPESAPAGAVPLSSFDEDESGPDDEDPAPWCSADPPGLPNHRWCLDAFGVDSAGPGEIQVTETYQGTGDPRPTR